MQKLHGETLEIDLKGEHVQRHRQGLWNGIWTDMFIDTSFMRCGASGGFIGTTLNEKAVHRWAMSLHICSRLMKDMADLKDFSSVDITSHKVELASQIKYDENDWPKLCIDPLNIAGQAHALVNIVSGCICPDEVNVHDAVDLGKAQMEENEASWPEEFHQPFKKRVCTMKECKKKTRTDTAE